MANQGDWPIRTRGRPIEPKDLDFDALKVLRRLSRFGYDAYLVGGGVRDLLLGKMPKDFDVATSAKPGEVRKLFRNCRLIGRRFRLAHILFAGGKIIEVATFRAEPLSTDDGDELITDDNEFGTPETDARRRDFTMNGLFYDPGTGEVIDYVGGLADLDRRCLRSIGDPALRFREDPVRMLRAVKFAARLDLKIDPADWAAIIEVRSDLRRAAVPRLFEELLRMLWGGAGRRSIELLHELNLLDLLLPEISAWRSQADGDERHAADQLLEALDARCGGQPCCEHGLLLAALFWPPFQALMEGRRATARQVRAAAEALVAPTAVRLQMPRRDLAVLVATLDGQFRLDTAGQRRGNRRGLARQPHFASIHQLLELRAVSESLPDEVLAPWRALAKEAPPPPDPRRRPPRRRSQGRRRR